MKIWANTIVNNEENFIWFAVMSVVDYVDKILIWDTGSTDRTVEIIQEIKKLKGNKIEFKEIGEVDKFQFTKMRQKMLEESNCDWILILDGDEIWWEESIKKVVGKINTGGKRIEGIVIPFIVPVGDIYHIQEEEAGRYEHFGRRGHLILRAISKNIPELNVDLPYGKEGFFDKDKKLVHEREKVIFLNAPYFHATHLKRSSLKRKYNKFKYELGSKFPEGFKLPEILFASFPKIVPSPFVKLSGFKLLKAGILTPLRKIKRRLT
ncbi:MAG: glycosyltransferase [bacterium]|nr:glycosyltransferase [bacterium]